MNFKDLAARLGLDEEDFMELVDLFVDTSVSDIAKIKQALTEQSAQDAASAAHSIKGAAGNLGFEKISILARDMEMQAKDGDISGFDEYVSDLDGMVQTLKQ